MPSKIEVQGISWDNWGFASVRKKTEFIDKSSKTVDFSLSLSNRSEELITPDG